MEWSEELQAIEYAHQSTIAISITPVFSKDLCNYSHAPLNSVRKDVLSWDTVIPSVKAVDYGLSPTYWVVRGERGKWTNYYGTEDEERKQ